MSSTEDSSTSDTCSDSSGTLRWQKTAEMLRTLKEQLMKEQLMEEQGPRQNPACPLPRLTGAQYMELNLKDPRRCKVNLRMDPDAFMELHNMLLQYGLPGTFQCSSIEAFGMYVWTCAHGAAMRECRDRFERSLDTVSRKLGEVADVMFMWAQKVLVPPDVNYARVSQRLADYAPWFDGCIGAIDGTHINVEVNQESKADFINRKGETTINVCAIVNMDGLFTYVAAGKAGACHDMAVLRDCQQDQRFPHPPAGRYYLADAGYMEEQGYMTPFRGKRYHMNDFRGIDMDSLEVQEKFNYVHSSLRNVIERRFGSVKEKWHILHGVPFFTRRKQSKIIISCFAMHNYLWLRTNGPNPGSYELSYWVHLNLTTPTTAVRELIAAAVWAG